MRAVFLIAGLYLFSGKSFCQDKVYTSLQEIIGTHLASFKKDVNQPDAKVYFLVDLSKELLNDYENVWYVQPRLHAESFRRKDDNNFLIEFLISDTPEGIKVSAVNFRINKRSGKKLTLTNLGSGRSYLLGKQ